MWDQLLKAIEDKDEPEALKIIAQMIPEDFDRDYSKLKPLQSPIHLASSLGLIVVVQALINIDSELVHKTDDMGNIPLHYAADIAVAQMLLDAGSSVSAKNLNDDTPLHHAAEDGHQEVVELLINKHHDLVFEVNNQKQTALHLAVCDGCEAVVELLINRYPKLVFEVDSFGKTSIYWACFHGYENVVKLLINKYPELVFEADSFGRIAIHYAALNGHEAILNILLADGTDINAIDKDGNTPLHLAACCSHSNMNADTINDSDYDYTRVIKFLLDCGANLGAANNGGDTPLHLAAKNSNQEGVKYLITRNANLEAINELGNTPLNSVACTLGIDKNIQTAIVEILLKNGANINHITKEGNSLLHHVVARNCYIPLVKTLLTYGADINITNHMGQKPLDLIGDHEEQTKTSLEELFATVNITNQAIQYANSSDTILQVKQEPIKHLDLFIDIVIRNFDQFNPLSEDGKLFNRLERTTTHAGLSDEDSLQVKNAIQKALFVNKAKEVIDCEGFPSLQFLAKNNLLIEQFKSTSNKEKDNIQLLYTSGAEDQPQLEMTLRGETNDQD
ncbi:MAG: ankyrin repeat domain-containing protein [Rickettsiaceae bacterium]|nr:MAG: ankyrin repeat domain-containing protein [Rickettsiaceae bacterium]